LRHAHDKGVVHRDIKPDNIFLARKDGEVVVKILDFGIAKLYAGSADDPAQTRAGLTVGTPSYLSPEQAVGGEIRPASDLYSTSVVLYEMLTGRTPYIESDPVAMLTAHVSREPPTFAEVAPELELPSGLEAVIRRGLEKVQAERIGSALEYTQALDEVLHAAGYPVPVSVRASNQVGIPSPPYGVPTPPPGSLTPPPIAYAPPTAGTPQPFDATASLGVAQTQSVDRLPPPARHVSLADAGAPIPRKWKLVAVGVIGVVALVGLAVILGGSSGSKGKRPPPPPSSLKTPPPVDKETQLKAALHDLESGKTCADRKAAIPVLADLGDERAIAPLKKARYRMRGGVLGVGDSNTNACLKADAEKAITKLGGTFR
jgi:serine/threonine protein kinase